MVLKLTHRERSALEQTVREQRVEARFWRRSRMILMAADGTSVSATSRALGTSRARVTEWLARFDRERLDGLVDLSRSGRPRIVTPLERHQVVAAACQSPKAFGEARQIWTRESLAAAVVRSGLVRSISPSTVAEILDAAEIRPHRVKAWCHSNDPEFQSKMRSIVRLYLRRPRGEPVLCVDEKTGMQALSRARSLQPPQPGRPARRDFEYRRNGTRCLFACFNIATGRVLGCCTKQRRREDFLEFMDRVAAAYRQARVHIVLDNLNTHRDTSQGAFITEWNRRHGNRFVFHYTPTHGSWLNQVELWFGIMARRVLRYGDFGHPDHLVTTIESFIEEWNKHEAHPFRWTYRGTPLVS
jgi:transposase